MSDKLTEQGTEECLDKGGEYRYQSIGRRSLLKKMAVTSGVVAAASLLPSEWLKPIVGVGVLPAHAQMSGERGPGQITSCDYIEGNGVFFPSCIITPAIAGVAMTLTVLIGGSPAAKVKATTTAGGNATATVDVFNLGWNGIDSLVLEWSFAFLADGEDTCSSTVLPNRPV